MAKPQVENGYTRIANELFEAVLQYNCPGRQRDIIFAVIRFTYGFRKIETELPIKKIANFLHRKKEHVSKDFNKLVKNNVIIIIQEAFFNKPRIVSLNKNYEEWIGRDANSAIVAETATGAETGTVAESAIVDETATDELQNEQPGGGKNETKVVAKTATIKESKETLKKSLKKEPPPRDYIDLVIKIFCEEYQDAKGIEYVVINREKDRSAVGKLQRHYQQELKNRGEKKNSEESLEDFRKFFRRTMQLKDNWLQENMSIPIVLSQFNQIKQKIKKDGNSISSASKATIKGFAGFIIEEINDTESPGN